MRPQDFHGWWRVRLRAHAGLEKQTTAVKKRSKLRNLTEKTAYKLKGGFRQRERKVALEPGR